MTWRQIKEIFDQCVTWGEFKQEMSNLGFSEDEAEEYWANFVNYLADTI